MMRSQSVERRTWSCRESVGLEAQPRLTAVAKKVRRRCIPRPYPNVHEHARRINSGAAVRRCGSHDERRRTCRAGADRCFDAAPGARFLHFSDRLAAARDASRNSDFVQAAFARFSIRPALPYLGSYSSGASECADLRVGFDGRDGHGHLAHGPALPHNFAASASAHRRRSLLEPRGA